MGEAVIRLANADDFDIMYELWKKNRDMLGIPWKSVIRELIEKRTFYVIENDRGNVVGMLAYKVMPRKKEIWLIAAVVQSEYRGLGYGKRLFEYVLSQIPRIGFPVYLSAIDGAGNNDFYDHFGNVVWWCNYKTITTRVYEFKLTDDKKISQLF